MKATLNVRLQNHTLELNMPITQTEIDGFHDFATRRAKASLIDSFADLYLEWESLRERADINAEIERGLADVASGRYAPAKEATVAIAHELGLPDP